MTVDTTIHTSDLITWGVMIVAGLKVFFKIWTEQTDIRRIVGHEGPPNGPSGLVKGVLDLRGDVDDHAEVLLINGLDRRRKANGV